MVADVAVAEEAADQEMLQPSGREWPDGRGGGGLGAAGGVPALLLEDCCQEEGSRDKGDALSQLSGAESHHQLPAPPLAGTLPSPSLFQEPVLQ